MICMIIDFWLSKNKNKISQPKIPNSISRPPKRSPFWFVTVEPTKSLNSWSVDESRKNFVELIDFLWESCQLSATYDLWLKAESWSLNFEIYKF